jgi:2-succinyl-6-hydroxy-2,4-cyclohexadiene-1-carboxylate synthase
LSSLVLLHGFFQDSRVWQPIKAQLEQKGFTVYTPDLPGFGSSHVNHEHELNTDAQVYWLLQYIESLNQPKLFVAGYSMGARLLMQSMVQLQSYVDGFILESVTNGISDDIERITRQENDFRLAQFALSDFKGFQQFWENHPTLQPVKLLSDTELKRLRAIQLDQKPKCVAASLMHFGTAAMPYVPTSSLRTIIKPVLFITGEQDQKFTAKAKELVKVNPLFKHEIVPNCGHRVYLEQQEMYLSKLLAFTNQTDL